MDKKKGASKTLICHPERSEGSQVDTDNEILRFAQNDIAK